MARTRARRPVAAALALACVALTGPAQATAPHPGTSAAPPLGTALGTAHAPTPYALPVPGGTVQRTFVRPAQRWAAGHRGVDVSADDGVVRAPADGTVTWSGHVVDRGVLTITHDDGLRTSLEPVEPLVEVGVRVRRGEPVAVVSEGPWHCASACVHWGVRRGREYLDPLSLLARREVRLLPWDG